VLPGDAIAVVPGRVELQDPGAVGIGSLHALVPALMAKDETMVLGAFDDGIVNDLDQAHF
jgi:hypothetical protein